MRPEADQVRPSIIVHGGAWAIPDSQKDASRVGVEAAARVGYNILVAGGSALDAVEAAVRALEDDPTFDAGHGSCLTSGGTIEMDASIMSDSSKTGVISGAVASISCARNPISVARMVMECTPHVLLVGTGADTFAKDVKASIVGCMEELVTKEAISEWERFKHYGTTVNELFNVSGRGHDTVGAVARDTDGTLACATSTGGITFKRIGRVGDSPIVGAGLFCDREFGACSTTGHGESIVKVGLARLAIMYMEMGGKSRKEAVQLALCRMKEKTGGCGGLILLDKQGEWVKEFSTERMAWACIEKNGTAHSGIERGD